MLGGRLACVRASPLDLLLEEISPVVGECRDTDHALQPLEIVFVAGIEAGDLRDRQGVLGSLDQKHLVACCNFALGDHLEIEAEAAAREKSLHHIVATESQPKLEAWQSRLGHHDLRRADTKAVADLQGILIQPLGGQVLTENAPRQSHVRKLASPVGVVFARINVGRLVRPTMHR